MVYCSFVFGQIFVSIRSFAEQELVAPLKHERKQVKVTKRGNGVVLVYPYSKFHGNIIEITETYPPPSCFSLLTAVVGGERGGVGPHVSTDHVLLSSGKP